MESANEKKNRNEFGRSFNAKVKQKTDLRIMRIRANGRMHLMQINSADFFFGIFQSINGVAQFSNGFAWLHNSLQSPKRNKTIDNVFNKCINYSIGMLNSKSSFTLFLLRNISVVFRAIFAWNEMVAFKLTNWVYHIDRIVKSYKCILLFTFYIVFARIITDFFFLWQ